MRKRPEQWLVKLPGINISWLVQFLQKKKQRSPQRSVNSPPHSHKNQPTLPGAEVGSVEKTQEIWVESTIKQLHKPTLLENRNIIRAQPLAEDKQLS